MANGLSMHSMARLLDGFRGLDSAAADYIWDCINDGKLHDPRDFNLDRDDALKLIQFYDDLDCTLDAETFNLLKGVQRHMRIYERYLPLAEEEKLDQDALALVYDRFWSPKPYKFEEIKRDDAYANRIDALSPGARIDAKLLCATLRSDNDVSPDERDDQMALTALLERPVTPPDAYQKVKTIFGWDGLLPEDIVAAAEHVHQEHYTLSDIALNLGMAEEFGGYEYGKLTERVIWLGRKENQGAEGESRWNRVATAMGDDGDDDAIEARVMEAIERGKRWTRMVVSLESVDSDDHVERQLVGAALALFTVAEDMGLNDEYDGNRFDKIVDAIKQQRAEYLVLAEDQEQTIEGNVEMGRATSDLEEAISGIDDLHQQLTDAARRIRKAVDGLA